MQTVWMVLLMVLLGMSHQAHAGPIGGGGGTAGLTHATDCTNGGVMGTLGQTCTDLDDGKLWTCKTPAAGGTATVCDSPGDWLATGFSVVGGGITNFNGATGTTQTVGGTAPVAVSTNTGTNTTTVALTGQVPGTQVSNTAAGGIAATTAQAALNELDTEKQPLDADLTTLAGKTIAGTGATVRLSTGTFIADECVKVDASGNLATAGAACGTGTGSGAAQGLQANKDVGATITNAVNIGSAVCTGDASHYVCLYGNVTDGVVDETIGSNRVWKLADTFAGKIIDDTGASIIEFDNETKNVLVPNTLTVAGSLIAPGVVKQNSSTSAPTVNDDADDYPVGSLWIHTTPNPDVIYICTDNTPGAAVWVPYSSFTQVDKSLNDAFNVGKTITGATSSANALCVGDGTGKKCEWYDSGDGWHEEVTPFGHKYIDIPSTFAFILRYAGTEIVRWDSTGNQKFANTGKPAIAIPWSAAGVETDGTNCATQAQSQINSGVRAQDFGCVAFTTGAGTFYQIFEMRPAWDFALANTTGITFLLRLRTLGTSSQVWKADVWLWCFGDGEQYPGDVSFFDTATPQEISITTGTTANVRRTVLSPAIIPGNTCAAGDSLAFRVRTKSGHTATAAAAKIIGGYLEPKYAQLGD